MFGGKGKGIRTNFNFLNLLHLFGLRALPIDTDGWRSVVSKRSRQLLHNNFLFRRYGYKMNTFPTS